MSLLLDALKKAAEQKAAKTSDEKTELDTGSTDETALDVSADEAQGRDGDDTSIPRHQQEDETDLDHTRLDTRLERARTGGEDGTETRVDSLDATQTHLRSPSEQMQTGEDETIFLADQDSTETRDDTTFTEGLSQAREDETEHTQSRPREDETALTQSPFSEDETEFTQGHQREDETELTQGLQREDETEFTRGMTREDETEHTEAAARQDDTGSIPTESAVDETEHQVARLQGGADKDADVSRAQQDQDDTLASDDDMSLLLVEREETQLTSPTSITDPQKPQDALRVLRTEAADADDSVQADPPTGRGGGGDRTSVTDTTQSRTRSSDTLTNNPATATRPNRGVTPPLDTTSTHTYAPDNYDRTLMRLPSDDASKLFAGMKSDSDVVMTPDYAKQVFRSKSSVQRAQHYKFYGGIAVVILLSIGVYGVFEYQGESETIDSGLRPLKNDPMPGIIQSGTDEQPAEPLFTEAEVNERALEIIQSMQDGEPVSDEQQDAGDQAPAGESVSEAAAETATAGQSAPVQPATGRAVDTARSGESPAAGDTVPVKTAPPTAAASSGATIIASLSEPSAGTAGSSASTLQIQMGNRSEEKQLLLREAYEAYRSGNDALAMQRYNQVLEIDRGNRNALLARAAIHIHGGNSAAAIEDYRTLLLANPKDSLAMTSLLAVASFSPRETETQLKLMIREEPESPHLNFALANVYGAQNRWREAQGHYYKALQYNPDDPNYAYNLAVSLEHISQPAVAVSYYRRALENYDKGLATFSRELVDRRLEKLAQP